MHTTILVKTKMVIMVGDQRRLFGQKRQFRVGEGGLAATIGFDTTVTYLQLAIILLFNLQSNYHMDRRLWTPEEDHQISRLVAKFGTKKWPLISQRLCAETQFQRTGKQCRQRWYNHLNPQISSAAWSQQEEERLFEAHKHHGNKWKVISQQFVGRTDNSIKNHFYSTIRRCLRRINKLQGEKNSTLKMRSIKPYVLSKILADRNLTETILELGKVKPNKYRKEFNVQCMQEFNQMISKLYDINHEYQRVKNHKKQIVDQKIKITAHPKSEESFSFERDSDDSMGLQQDQEPSSPKRQSKTDQSLFPGQFQRQVCQKVSNNRKPKLTEPILRKKRSNKNLKPEPEPSFQELKQVKILEQKDPFSNKRARKSINYMKLNEGVLCENERHEMIQETHQDSQMLKKRDLNIASLEHIQFYQPLYGDENLSEIIEEDEKQNEKDVQNHPYLFHLNQNESKGLRNFDIAYPSPSFCKSNNFFDDLVVVGTQMKVGKTPKAQRIVSQSKISEERMRQSHQDFIQEILQINFDPEFAQNYGEEENDSKINQ